MKHFSLFSDIFGHNNQIIKKIISRFIDNMFMSINRNGQTEDDDFGRIDLLQI